VNRKLPLFLITLLVVMLLAASPVIASDNNVIRVNGEALISVAPDQGIIILAVETVDADARVAVAENAETMDRVVAALKGLGLEDDQIKTGIFRLGPQQPNFWFPEVSREEVPQYRVHNSLTVTLEDLEMIGQVIDTAIDAGANQVQSVHFDLRNREAVMLQALGDAVAQARVKGDVMARAAGVEITGVRSVREEWSSFSPRMSSFQVEMALMDAASGFHPGTAIMPNDVELFANVTVEFSF